MARRRPSQRARRKTAYHEAGHAVAHHFFPLTGRTSHVTIHPDELADYNAPKADEINHAAGLHSSGRTLSPIVGRSVDREQIHHTLVALLAGRAAGWVFAGESLREGKRDRKAEEEIRRQGDGTDDYSKALRLLLDADPFDGQAARNRIPDDARARLPTGALTDRYFRPAFDAHMGQILADFEALWREALEFVVKKWVHIQAVADALWKRRKLSGEEVTEIIERVEDRVRRLPPNVANQLESLRGGDAADRG